LKKENRTGEKVNFSSFGLIFGGYKNMKNPENKRINLHFTGIPHFRKKTQKNPIGCMSLQKKPESGGSCLCINR
jgi:hypothetical protein